MNRWNTENFQTCENILHDTIMMDICHYTSIQIIESTTPRVNRKVKYKLWVCMHQCSMHQCRLILGRNVPFRGVLLIMREAMHE